ncbi:oxygen evolving enhancer protein 3 containing protein [Zea mays]|uniref:Oxygen evolving enhancer protein 3 containing protein n=1 Tax=Zea mays TaxID=4577 RepID=B4FT19_MAIZE|nr:oxygen evolving enhancer protein 3 containing protein [Zea mays]ACF85262.1 unknown [Zea mays]ACG48907.1 oxygen evolving enhancer protein 3 containing protein [Zea mays]|eukprot:NP_001141040.1 oxygen evolving enhancer protein 3 containing protein [Zea mays]
MATYLNAPPAATTTTASCRHAFSGGSLRLLRPSRPTLHVTCQAAASSQQPSSPSRRSACLLGIACAVLLRPRAASAAETDDEPANNGWWLTEFPLPVPKIVNKEINNAETGTRSFLKNGIYMADIGPSFAAHAYRLRSTAFDLLALEDLLGKDASNYVNKYLRLKSTFMYYDFDKLISAAEDKPPFVDLANRLFDSFETLQEAVTAKDDARIGDRYAETKLILQELMAKMA